MADDYAALWDAIEQEADAEADRAQERGIRTEFEQHRAQLPLELTDPRERAAWFADTQAMTDRLVAITAERDIEPCASRSSTRSPHPGDADRHRLPVARQARQARPRRPRRAPLTVSYGGVLNYRRCAR